MIPRRAQSSEGNVVALTGTPGITDAELVQRVRAGDRWAEEALFRKHVDFIAGLALRLLRHRADADDVVQDTFVAALDGLDRLADGRSLRAWLASIAVHEVHRRFRRRRLLSLLGLHHSSHDVAMSAMVQAGTSQEARAELAELEARLERASDVDRAAWVLRYVEGYLLEEVAELCGCSPTTAKRRIARARELVGPWEDDRA